MRIYHTSDLHDHRRIAAPMNALRAAKPGLYADCGDSLRGSQTMYHRNEPIIAELDAAHVDVQAMGNREFHYVFGAVRARAAKMKHPFTCANLIDLKGRALPFTSDVVLHRDDPSTSSGQAAAWTLRFFGLLVVQYSSGSPWERLFGWRFLDPVEVAEHIAATTPPETTLIALSHLGLRHDRILAQRVPRLDLILGGHSHDTLFAPEIVGGVPIVHAGPYGKYASRTELAKDAAGRARIADFALEPLA
ncbi:MAG TPA: metallophosphoesterase [Candidatus Elarobacter sp.]|jgi:2',3'-cyclic-nucleotide 2'-phosphodiesterase (5'-nucleotidase family)|nr:metallophosphoesterase [Candidatus Elarobacter sp.]